MKYIVLPYLEGGDVCNLSSTCKGLEYVFEFMVNKRVMNLRHCKGNDESVLEFIRLCHINLATAATRQHRFLCLLSVTSKELDHYMFVGNSRCKYLQKILTIMLHFHVLFNAFDFSDMYVFLSIKSRKPIPKGDYNVLLERLNLERQGTSVVTNFGFPPRKEIRPFLNKIVYEYYGD